MKKINIIFNGEDYQIDESLLAPVIEAVKAHLSTDMIGTGAIINFDGTSYNISSTSLSISRNDFTSFLQTISGNGATAVINGIEYSMDSTKLTTAKEGLGTTFGKLEAGEITPETPDVPDDPGFGSAGLYQTGTDIMVASWAQLIEYDQFSVVDGVLSEGSKYNNSFAGDLVLPDDGSVTSINKLTFADCAALTSVIIPSSVTEIGEFAFQHCYGLISIKISENVTLIDQGMFSGCSKLTSIEIPDRITSIRDYAFYQCQALTDVYYKGAEEQWNAITIGEGNTYLTNATIHYNYQG